MSIGEKNVGVLKVTNKCKSNTRSTVSRCPNSKKTTDTKKVLINNVELANRSCTKLKKYRT